MEKAGMRNRRCILIAPAVVLTLLRIWLAMRTPLFLQANALYDDWLQVKYALSILQGNWLGDFCSTTYAKTVSYPLLLCLNFIAGIPYSFGLICSYVIACLLAVLALHKFLKSRVFSVLLYLFLLYSPVMFHEENVQKVYRGGYIVVFALLVTASAAALLYECRNIGDGVSKRGDAGSNPEDAGSKPGDAGSGFADTGSPIRRMAGWSVLGIFAYPVFWYLKEDSVWILPFVAVVTGCAVIEVIWLFHAAAVRRKEEGSRTRRPEAGNLAEAKADRQTEDSCAAGMPQDLSDRRDDGHHIAGAGEIAVRLILLLLPLISLAAAALVYRQVNGSRYGLYEITDRSGSNYQKVIQDLIVIEDPGIGETWVTRDMIHRACDASPTLKSIEPQIFERMNLWLGDLETIGDLFVWILREAVDSAGIYAQGSQAVEAFYGKIDSELQAAFADGTLKRNKERIYISPVARGYTVPEFLEYCKGRMRGVAKALILYSENATEVKSAAGTYPDIAVMSQLTNSEFVWQDTHSSLDDAMLRIVDIDRGIVSFYKKTGLAAFFAGFAGILFFAVLTVIRLIKRSCSREDSRLLVVLIGMGGSVAALILGVLWFGNFLEMRKIYDYLSAAVPLIHIMEMTGIFMICRELCQRFGPGHR